MWIVWFFLYLCYFFWINFCICMYIWKKYFGLKYLFIMKYINGMECLGLISKYVFLMLDCLYWVFCFMMIVINFRCFIMFLFNKWFVKIWWLWLNINVLCFFFVFYNNLKKCIINKYIYFLYVKLWFLL